MTGTKRIPNVPCSRLCPHPPSSYAKMPDTLQPPVPFDDFTFAFDPALHNLFPSPPPLPPSADLFSTSETNDLFGFLDHINWDLETDTQNVANNSSSLGSFPAETAPLFHSTMSPQKGTQSIPDLTNRQADDNTPCPPSDASPTPSSSTPSASAPTPSASSSNPKPLLSTPQKRLNHIMSEQKRRNAIRDGYVQLTALLAPAGAPPGAGMPTRGRPKGSGSRGGRGGKGGVAFKGKSGILFRAVEYVRWLEDGRDALLQEVMKMEAAAGIRH